MLIGGRGLVGEGGLIEDFFNGGFTDGTHLFYTLIART